MRKALCVGIDSYQNIDDLHGCVNDANAVKAALERNGDGTLNFDVKIMCSTRMMFSMTSSRHSRALIRDVFLMRRLKNTKSILQKKRKREKLSAWNVKENRKKRKKKKRSTLLRKKKISNSDRYGRGETCHRIMHIINLVKILSKSSPESLNLS